MQGKERRECHSSHPTPEIIKRQNLERSGVSEQLAKEIVKRVTENQEVFQSYRNFLQRCERAKEMGSSRPVTMREEAENLVLSKRKTLAGIKRRRTNLNVMTQTRINQILKTLCLLQGQA